MTAAGSARESIASTKLWLAIAVILLLPLVGLPREDQRDALPIGYSYFYVADVALIALGLLGLPAVVGSLWRKRTVESLLWLLLYALLAVAFVLNPSPSGIDLLTRLLAAAALYRTLADVDQVWRRRVAVALGVTAGIQALVALGQVATGSPLGLTALGEMSEGLVRNRDIGPPLARGLLGHEYILGALALLSATVLAGEALRSARPAAWLVGSAVALSSAGLIYGRTIAVAFALAWAAFVPAAVRDGRYRSVLIALALGIAVTSLLFAEGWAVSFSRGIATERTEMIQQAAVIVEERPFFGVGPGRYLEVLRSRPELHTTQAIGNVHSVPALLAAEAGIPAGIVGAALLVLIGIRALRAGTLGVALYASFVLWAVVDVLPYVTPQGIVLSAAWLASIRHAERWPV